MSIPYETRRLSAEHRRKRLSGFQRLPWATTLFSVHAQRSRSAFENQSVDRRTREDSPADHLIKKLAQPAGAADRCIPVAKSRATPKDCRYPRRKQKTEPGVAACACRTNSKSDRDVSATHASKQESGASSRQIRGRVDNRTQLPPGGH